MERKEARLPADLVQSSKHHADLRRAKEAEQEEDCRHIVGSIPPDLPVLSVSPFSPWADGCVEYSRDTRAEAAALVSIIPPEPCAFIRDGCCGMYPQRWVDELDDAGRERREIHDEILPVWWTKEGPYPFEGVARLCWYSKGCASSGLFEVCVRIESDPARLREEEVRDTRGRKMESRWHRDHWPNGEWINYSSGTPGKPGHSLAYFFREPGGGAPMLGHYLAGGDKDYPNDEEHDLRPAGPVL